MNAFAASIPDSMDSSAGEPLSRPRRYAALLWAAGWACLLAWLWAGSPAADRVLGDGVTAPVPVRWLGLAWGLLGAWRPDFFFYSLALALPWFGDQNGSIHPVHLLDCGLYGMLVRHQLRRALGLVRYRRSALDPWVRWFLFLSLLCVLPQWHHIHTEFWLQGRHELYVLFKHFGTSPTFGAAAWLRLLAEVALFQALRDDPWPAPTRRRFVHAALGGLAFASLLGLLDYFHLVSLHWWRADNRDITRFGYGRLQSLFGHSGWFAEYLAYLAPFALAMGLAGVTRAQRQIGWGLAIALAPVQLLTMQRGEWVAFAAGYAAVMGGFAMAQRDRRAWLRSLMLPAAVLAVCFAGVFALSHDFRHRFGEMLLFRDRASIWDSAWRIIRDYPLQGTGFGNFYAVHNIFFPDGTPYFSLDKTTAHNLYLHVWAERGAIGLILFLAIAGLGLRAAARLRRAGEGPPVPALDLRLGVLGGLCAFMVDGIVQYPFYIRELALIFWILLGMAVWSAPPLAHPGRRRLVRRIAAALSVLALLSYYCSNYRESFFPAQAWIGERFMTVAREEAELPVPQEGARFKLALGAMHPGMNIDPLVMAIDFDGNEIGRAAFDHIGVEEIVLTLPENRQPWQRVTVRASRLFSPLRDMGWRNPPAPLVGVLYQPLEPLP